MKKTLAILTLLTLTSCVSSQLDRMEWLGKAPPMTKMMENSEKQSAPMNWPVYDDSKDKLDYVAANSLWDKKNKTFFKDSRAVKVGDILTVKVRINDKAELDNKTERKRQDSDTGGVGKLYGLEEVIKDVLPGSPATTSSLLSRTGDMKNLGEGNIDRKEVVEIDVAAVVTDVMDNGNLVIYGSQEIRVNFEIRQLTVQGVIRPEDISAKNDIAYNQIAEARISYGGKGIIMDIQQPRIGNQLADIISPF
ncbi:MAG TPA: flagellar basal body L-ring protein [Alphaproteobacteria bacterium]|nr:flagellar basal body L-ring protein [Alphaproteobacteria bacterium]